MLKNITTKRKIIIIVLVLALLVGGGFVIYKQYIAKPAVPDMDTLLKESGYKWPFNDGDYADPVKRAEMEAYVKEQTRLNNIEIQKNIDMLKAAAEAEQKQ